MKIFFGFTDAVTSSDGIGKEHANMNTKTTLVLVLKYTGEGNGNP